VPPSKAAPPHAVDGPSGGSIIRGVLLFACAAGITVGAGCAWMLARAVDPIGGPEWAFAFLTLSLTVVPVLMVLAGISLLRGYEARTTARLAFAVNATTLILGAANLLSR
jgi:hypothetical protein